MLIRDFRACPSSSDKVTGLARGSAFIKFCSREAALSCVEAAEVLTASATNSVIIKGRKCR
jgi:RNA recognition motif-containing protein